MKLVPIHVQWEDAESEDAWVDFDRLDDHEGLPLINTLGFLVKEDRKFIVVALSVDLENEVLSSSIKIPKAFCKKIRKLRVKV